MALKRAGAAWVEVDACGVVVGSIPTLWNSVVIVADLLGSG